MDAGTRCYTPGRAQEPRHRRIACQGPHHRALSRRRLPGPGVLRSCPRPAREPRQGQVRRRRRPRLRPGVRDLGRPAQAGLGDREGGQGLRPGLPRHRPRSRGRGDRLARRRGRPRPRIQDAAGDVQRDHRVGHPRGVRPPAPDRHGPRRRAADAADRRPARRLHAQPAAVAQGPWRPVGRPRPVGRGPPRRRARARDHRVHRPRVLDDRGDPGDRRRRALRGRARADRRRRARRRRRGHRRAASRGHRAAPSGRHQGRDAGPRSARRRRRSRPRRSSRRRAASSASARSGRCRSPSGCTRGSRPARARSA